MVPGTPGTIICARCGWQNDTTSRMCGGCGTPLRSADPGATSHANTGPVGWAPGQDDLASQDAPTAVSPNIDFGPGMMAPQSYAQLATPPAIPQMPTPLTPAVAPPVAWPGRGQATVKPTAGRFRWWIIPVALVIFIMVLGLLGLGIWGLGIQPSTANSVSTTFSAALDSAFTQMNSSLTPHQNGRVQLSEATLDALVKTQSPSSGPVTTVDFTYITFPYLGFKLTYNFNFFGTELQDTTAAFSIENGRLVARATVVDGSMSLFVSGDQMEQLLNKGLGYLTNIQGKVQSILLANSILTIQLMHS